MPANLDDLRGTREAREGQLLAKILVPMRHMSGNLPVFDPTNTIFELIEVILELVNFIYYIQATEERATAQLPSFPGQ